MSGYAHPQQPYGVPPPQPYGAPPQQYGAPPQQYGAPPPPQNYYQQQWELQPQPQQQYFPPQGQGQGQPMTGVMPPSYDGSVNPETGLPTKFNPKPKYNDLWAVFLFLIQIAGFIVLCYFMVKQVVDNRRGPNTQIDNIFSKDGLVSLVLGLAVSAVFSIIYFFLTQAFPQQIIKITFALSIIFYFCLAAYYLYLRIWIAGIIMAVFALLYATTWFYWRSRIPFATVMLRTVTAISREYPATFAISFLGLFFQIAYNFLFMVVLAGVYDNSFGTGSDNNKGKFYGLVVFAFFSYYWSSQVFTNIVHTTVCGVYATYYFMKGSPQGMSASPTLASLKRSCTTSLGSICFGSLIIAIIQTLKLLANIARGESDGILAFLACLIECILGCIEGLVEYINKYAFAQVATYGKPYIRAAKDTWSILKDRGVEQIINDNLIGNVWSMAGIFGGALSGISAYLYLRNVTLTSNTTGFMIFIIVIAAIMGLQIVFTVGTVIDSGVVATFVCLAEDPAALARTKPELFEQIRLTWPEVVQGVNY
ncbi:putative choline transporter, neither null mutation nor overexpression affects choline transport [Mortierella sp. GBA43]|nr:putative choline transporter, neither null mutation nor overexpression affects choline transport [Mortierella sp. GBA43]